MTDSTSYLKNVTINWLVGGEDTPEVHNSVYVALHDGDPGDSGEQNEIDSAGYTRAETVSGEDWDTSSTGIFENSSDILFDEAEEDWGEISHFSLWDGSEDTDNSLAKSALEETQTINSGDSAIFREGRLTGEFL